MCHSVYCLSRFVQAAQLGDAKTVSHLISGGADTLKHIMQTGNRGQMGTAPIGGQRLRVSGSMAHGLAPNYRICDFGSGG